MNRRAFTLIELMITISIMVLLASMSIPAFRGMMENANLSQGGQLVASQINLARQIASARNCNVEVRLIQLPAVNTDIRYRALQLWAVTGGKLAPVTRLAPLPTGIIIADDRQRSPIFERIADTDTMPVGGQTGDCAYAMLQVTPSGRVSPAMDMNQMFFTVIPERAVDRGDFPNYVIVQIQPDTGTELIYRP
ncbi:MAG: Verru_Chthon cassette protein D [Verrucomicrobiales bacterium]|jgi:uncharacterized protein (TIGR02596 family)|nr:Verru_Chthon cassette protein D [Verrucomicrobiales bacterium]